MSYISIGSLELMWGMSIYCVLLEEWHKFLHISTLKTKLIHLCFQVLVTFEYSHLSDTIVFCTTVWINVVSFFFFNSYELHPILHSITQLWSLFLDCNPIYFTSAISVFHLGYCTHHFPVSSPVITLKVI